MKKVGFEIHESHLPLWENKDWRYAIVMGGRGNGRSGTASRYAVSQLLSKEYTRGAIMRAVHSDIRTSAWGELINRIRENEIESQVKITENDMYLEYGQNSLRAHGFKASSGSLTARLKSLAEYNFIWIEEAEEIGEDEFRTLDDSLRTTKGRIRIILSLNTPPKNHWILKKWFDLEPAEVSGFYIPKLKPEATNVLYISGTWRENEPNLDPNTVTRYQKYKETNPFYYWQMIEGLSPEVGVGKIYSGWKEIEEVPHEARLLGRGLDFGYDPDPAAIVSIYWHNGGYVVDEELYQTELLNEHLAASLKGFNNPQAPIIADSAEPKSIAELKTFNLNVIPCEKGRDSVQFGIKHSQGLKISYTKRSTNLKREYENYSWKVDKDGNNLGIEDPLCDNHAMSAIRYALMMFVGKNSMYDPENEVRERIEVELNARKVVDNSKLRAGL